jgi:RNA polymerase sigma factor (sigma-70 family)
MGNSLAGPRPNAVHGQVEDEQTRHLSDADLLAQCARADDEHAFHALLCRHGAMVLSVCRCVLSNEADAEDAFQATFLLLALKASSIRNPASVGSWLHGVAYRTALKARKRGAVRSKHEARAASPEPRPCDDLSWGEVQEVLHEELSSIAERYRAALVLCYLQNRTHDDAARLLGVAKSTLKKRLEQGRAILRAKLIRRGLGAVAVLLASAWPVSSASAAMPPMLLASTAHAATLTTAGHSIGSLVSPQVAALTESGFTWMFLTKTKACLVALFVTLALGSTTLLEFSPPPQPPVTEWNHDFRGGAPLPDWLKLSGATKDVTINPADAGMRITLPAQRPRHLPAGVEGNLVLTGDFEITAAFEMLSASKPTGGYGVGVSLNLARAADRNLYGKIARFWRVHEGSVFISEYWNNDPPKVRTLNSIPTEALTGRLRLARRGDVLHYLAAEGMRNDFQEVFQEKFTAEDLTHLRFVVSDSGEAGNAVDARLLQLSIVKTKPGEAGAPVPAPPVRKTAPNAPEAQPEPTPLPGRGNSLWWMLAILGSIVSGGMALILWRVLRSRRPVPVADDSGPASIRFPCAACGKQLKVRPKFAGKTIKCPGCGQGLQVPANETDENSARV